MILSLIHISEIAQEYVDQMNVASADCTAEKRELVEIEKQINNGVKAVISGMDIPELSAEIDRLRQRKLDLENIIAAKSSNPRAHYEPEEIQKELILLAKNFDSKAAIKKLVQKIYANADGSCTVHISVHSNGAGDRT